DASVTKLALRLERYPEVRAALDSRSTLYLEEFGESELLGRYREEVIARGVGAILVAPLVFRGSAFGALIARWRDPHPALGERAVSFATLAAAIVASALRGSGILDAIRERTQRVTRVVHFERERDRAIEQYRDFFEASADGTLVA